MNNNDHIKLFLAVGFGIDLADAFQSQSFGSIVKNGGVDPPVHGGQMRNEVDSLFRLLYKVPALRERFWKG